MSYYTVRRDDAELRIVICPKCSTRDHGVIDVTRFDDVIPYKVNGYLLKLMQCNVCKTYFTFYREDGLDEITKEEAIKFLEEGHCDMRENGEDQHGHSFYIIFKNKPPTITGEEYYRLIGFSQDKDGNYIGGDPKFEKMVKLMPSVNSLVYYRNIIQNIDFASMNYLNINSGRVDDYFKE